MSDAEGSEPVVLHDVEDAGITGSLTARRREDGGIVIVGLSAT
jgi:hypothetical protein